MGTRERAIAQAVAALDSGAFKERLERLVAVPSTSQEPAHAPDLARYLKHGIAPWLGRMGFRYAIYPNPAGDGGPIMLAERLEENPRFSVLTYGHGDTVRGLEGQWSEGLTPWILTRRGPRWYGRGTADNKGQHAINLTALETVLEERGGHLGFNLKLLLETGEERGSPGLRQFVEAHRDALAADVLIGSDGPRVAPEVPTIATGTRGTFHFDLVVSLRPGGVHSGHWGGLIADPAIVLAHALGAITDRHGRILIRDWLPQTGMPSRIRALLAECPVEGGEDAPEIDPGWGEPGLTAAEKIYGWNSFIVLALLSGKPEAPVNAVAPDARAHCQIRYTADSDPSRFAPALRRHLDVAGFSELRIEGAGVRMRASRTDTDSPWVKFTAASLEQSLGKRVQVIPNSSGGLPGDVFADHLGVPLIWIPHSYNGCRQHGPDEHLLLSLVGEGLAGMAGLWWDLSEKGSS